MQDASTLFSLYLISSALLLALGLPLQRERIPINRWYGFRTKRTLSDPKLWYAVNRITGFWLLVTGIATLLATIITHLLDLDLFSTACINSATYVIGLLITVVRGFGYLKNTEKK